MPSNYLILCCLLPHSIFPSIRVFSNESVLPIKWPKYWCFSFSISPSNEYSGLIAFRMYWLDLLAVQGTLMSLLQHHSSKASIWEREQDGGWLGGRGVPLSLCGYIRSTPSDTEVHAEHQLRADRGTWPAEKKIRNHTKLGRMKELGEKQ